MAVADLIRLLEVNPVYRARCVHTEISGPDPARYGSLDAPLPPSLAGYLDQNDIRL